MSARIPEGIEDITCESAAEQPALGLRQFDHAFADTDQPCITGHVRHQEAPIA